MMYAYQSSVWWWLSTPRNDLTNSYVPHDKAVDGMFIISLGNAPLPKDFTPSV